jgi:hypothetical protein
MNWYEAKQEAKRERLEEAAARRKREAKAKWDSGMERLRAIPFGQPILVGHYSEKRDRNYRRKACASVDKAIELNKEAGELEARAAAVGSGGISSDDPDAPDKLRERIEELKGKQERMKAANAAWRKAGNKAGRQADGSWLDKPYTFELTNNNANIRRLEQRLAAVERLAVKREEAETVEEVIGETRLVENREINRVQIFFPGKPAAEVRASLKQAGFRWAPSEGAWQRQLGGYAMQMARKIAETGRPW